MKRALGCLLGLIILGCQDIQPIEKPDNLIDKETMEEILFDIALVNAARGFNIQKLVQNKIAPEKYIFEKYNIDSVQYAQSTNYYSSSIEVYKKMHLSIQKRLDTLFQFHDSLAKIEKKHKDSIEKIKSEAKKKRLDSIRSLNKDTIIDDSPFLVTPKDGSLLNKVRTKSQDSVQ